MVDGSHLYTPDLSKIAISDTDIRRCPKHHEDDQECRSLLNDTYIDYGIVLIMKKLNDMGIHCDSVEMFHSQMAKNSIAE